MSSRATRAITSCSASRATDTLNGGDGNDRLDGGNGNDAMTGGNGDDVYVVGSPSDKVTESSAAGATTPSRARSPHARHEPRRLKLTSGDPINGTGNTLDNLLVGGGGANKLDGKAAPTRCRRARRRRLRVDNGGDIVDESGGNPATSTPSIARSRST